MAAELSRGAHSTGRLDVLKDALDMAGTLAKSLPNSASTTPPLEDKEPAFIWQTGSRPSRKHSVVTTSSKATHPDTLKSLLSKDVAAIATQIGLPKFAQIDSIGTLMPKKQAAKYFSLPLTSRDTNSNTVKGKMRSVPTESEPLATQVRSSVHECADEPSADATSSSPSVPLDDNSLAESSGVLTPVLTANDTSQLENLTLSAQQDSVANTSHRDDKRVRESVARSARLLQQTIRKLKEQAATPKILEQQKVETLNNVVDGAHCQAENTQHEVLPGHEHLVDASKGQADGSEAAKVIRRKINFMSVEECDEVDDEDSKSQGEIDNQSQNPSHSSTTFWWRKQPRPLPPNVFQAEQYEKARKEPKLHSPLQTIASATREIVTNDNATSEISPVVDLSKPPVTGHVNKYSMLLNNWRLPLSDQSPNRVIATSGQIEASRSADKATAILHEKDLMRKALLHAALLEHKLKIKTFFRWRLLVLQGRDSRQGASVDNTPTLNAMPSTEMTPMRANRTTSNIMPRAQLTQDMMSLLGELTPSMAGRLSRDQRSSVAIEDASSLPFISETDASPIDHNTAAHEYPAADSNFDWLQEHLNRNFSSPDRSETPSDGESSCVAKAVDGPILSTVVVYESMHKHEWERLHDESLVEEESVSLSIDDSPPTPAHLSHALLVVRSKRVNRMLTAWRTSAIAAAKNRAVTQRKYFEIWVTFHQSAQARKRKQQEQRDLISSFREQSALSILRASREKQQRYLQQREVRMVEPLESMHGEKWMAPNQLFARLAKQKQQAYQNTPPVWNDARMPDVEASDGNGLQSVNLGTADKNNDEKQAFHQLSAVKKLLASKMAKVFQTVLLRRSFQHWNFCKKTWQLACHYIRKVYFTAQTDACKRRAQILLRRWQRSHPTRKMRPTRRQSVSTVVPDPDHLWAQAMFRSWKLAHRKSQVDSFICHHRKRRYFARWRRRKVVSYRHAGKSNRKQGSIGLTKSVENKMDYSSAVPRITHVARPIVEKLMHPAAIAAVHNTSEHASATTQARVWQVAHPKSIPSPSRGVSMNCPQLNTSTDHGVPTNSNTSKLHEEPAARNKEEDDGTHVRPIARDDLGRNLNQVSMESAQSHKPQLLATRKENITKLSVHAKPKCKASAYPTPRSAEVRTKVSRSPDGGHCSNHLPQLNAARSCALKVGDRICLSQISVSSSQARPRAPGATHKFHGRSTSLSRHGPAPQKACVRAKSSQNDPVPSETLHATGSTSTCDETTSPPQTPTQSVNNGKGVKLQSKALSRSDDPPLRSAVDTIFEEDRRLRAEIKRWNDEADSALHKVLQECANTAKKKEVLSHWKYIWSEPRVPSLRARMFDTFYERSLVAKYFWAWNFVAVGQMPKF